MASEISPTLGSNANSVAFTWKDICPISQNKVVMKKNGKKLEWKYSVNHKSLYKSLLISDAFDSALKIGYVSILISEARILKRDNETESIKVGSRKKTSPSSI